MNDEMFQRILDEIKSSSKTINVLPLDAVSYTHLDVYKRQVIHPMNQMTNKTSRYMGC